MRYAKRPVVTALASVLLAAGLAHAKGLRGGSGNAGHRAPPVWR